MTAGQAQFKAKSEGLVILFFLIVTTFWIKRCTSGDKRDTEDKFDRRTTAAVSTKRKEN